MQEVSKSHPPRSTIARSAAAETAGPSAASPLAALPDPPAGVSRRKRGLAPLFRWLHTYLSMASFFILFFFAVTGLTLNHVRWFSKQLRTLQYRGSVQAAWVNAPSPKDVAKLEIVEHLRNTHGIRGALTDFRIDESQCAVSFKGPGYTADAFIDRQTGQYDLTESRMGFVAVLNDLHKGRDTGKIWSLMIDIAAILLTIVSLSGLVLILFLQRVRFSGVLAGIAAAVLCYLLYAIWVP